MKSKKSGFILAGVLLIFLLPWGISQFTSDRCPVRSDELSAAFPERGPLADMGKGHTTAQWSRKYDTNCQTCHTVFPRLNYYGEKFMRNGFQDPDDTLDDGDTKGKKEYGRLFIGKVEDWFGARISFQPVKVGTNGITVNGATKSSIDIGGANWIQFFTAGAFAKNFSVFNELEINSSGTVKHGWLILGAHNVVGERGWVNFQIGKISPVEWTAFSNRLRVFPEMTGFADKVNSSYRAASGVAQDNVNISSSQWGIQYYGYAGPVIWNAGVGNPKNATDVNRQKNFWGSLRLDMTNEASKFEGSSISVFAYRGIDTAATATAQITNNFWRIEPAFNIRWNEKLDIVGAFLYGRDNNVFLTAAATQDTFYGATGIVSYLIKERYQLGAQYDTVRQTKASTVENNRVGFHAGYLARENINLILTADTDIGKNGTQNHLFFATLRAMF